MTKTEQLFSPDNKSLNALLLGRAEDKISTELDGETVILDLASGIYSGLNEVGTSIWNLLDEPQSFASLLSALQEEYEVSDEQCRTDIIAFLIELVDNKLITVNEK